MTQHSKYIILQDDREKLPLIFPNRIILLRSGSTTYTAQLEVKRTRLETGDYALQDYEDVCLIERKGSLDEVAMNCLTQDGRRKFTSACERLQKSCALPALLFEGLPHQMQIRHSTYTKEAATDSFLRLIILHRITPLFLPSATFLQRRQVGEFAARLLINASMQRDHLCHSSFPPIPPALPTCSTTPT